MLFPKMKHLVTYESCCLDTDAQNQQRGVDVKSLLPDNFETVSSGFQCGRVFPN